MFFFETLKLGQFFPFDLFSPKSQFFKFKLRPCFILGLLRDRAAFSRQQIIGNLYYKLPRFGNCKSTCSTKQMKPTRNGTDSHFPGLKIALQGIFGRKRLPPATAPQLGEGGALFRQLAGSMGDSGWRHGRLL